MNYYLVNLSIADLMITAWCPIHSLVKELSSQNQYVLPAIFCKIGVFYTGEKLYCVSKFSLTFHSVMYLAKKIELRLFILSEKI